MLTVGKKAKQSWMKGEDFAAIRESLGYTQVEFARLLDVTSTSISGYEVGRVPIPKVVMVLVKAAKAGKIVLK